MSEPLPFLRAVEGGTLVNIAVQPKASRNELAGTHQDSLKVRITAPPVEGEANKACIKFFAKLLSVPKSNIEMVQGHKSRRKTLLVRGMSVAEIEERLGS